MAYNTLLQIIGRFYHFIKDVYFNKKSITVLWRTDRRKFWAMVMLMALFSFSVVSGPRMVIMSYDYVMLRRKYIALEQRYQTALDASGKTEGQSLATNTGGQLTTLPDINLDQDDDAYRRELYSKHYNDLINSLTRP